MNRKALEASFHDKRELDRASMSEEDFLKKYSNKSFYCITKSIDAYIFNKIAKEGKNKVILDYCCGTGKFSREVCRLDPKKVHGIDISEKEIQSATQASKDENLSDILEYNVMDAENTTFPDNTFDIVMCKGVLHHLDVNLAYKEIHRILKKGGIMIAVEALGYNPIIQLYRRLTPHLRTAWETDHILKMSEVELAKKRFRLKNIKFFYLVSILAIPLRNTIFFKPALAILQAIDAIILKIPLFRLMGWQMVFIMQK